MKILITGITGFLGSKLADSLTQKFEVIGITGLSKKMINNTGIKIYQASELDYIIENQDVVIMCHAAISSGILKDKNDSLFNANVHFTEMLINKFPTAYHLYISTIGVYDENEKLITEASSLNPESGYAVSKLWGEKTVSAVKNYGILRLSSLYGIGMKNNTIIPIYVSQALNNKQIEVWGDGGRKQNYLYINDALEYIEKMMINKSQGIYLATSRKEISNKELAIMIKSICRVNIAFKGDDNTISKRFNNAITREKLKIVNETNLLKGLKEYILWRIKQF